MPRFDQSFNGLCEQNMQDTIQLKQRYLDAKSKRVPKSKDKKQQDSIQSSVHVQQKFLKRPAEDHESSSGGGGGGNTGGASADSFEPPVKLQCSSSSSAANEGLTKFSVEIVQQLEFTTSAANSQPQQISTNVTVKAHTNASVKSDVSSPKPPSNPPQSTPQNLPKNTNNTTTNMGLDVGTLVECVKQEPDNDFADLDQCAAALEKDAAANGGAGFGGFTDLIGEDTNDEIITSDAFNDLISDISNYPELMKDFDFDDKSELNGLKVEDAPQHHHQMPDSNHVAMNKSRSPLVANYSPSPVFDPSKGRLGQPPYVNMADFCKTELSPAAQTLKQMAEQHQHKNQIGLSFPPGQGPPRPGPPAGPPTSNSRSPYSADFQFPQNDYGSPNQNFKNSPGDMIKQELIYQNAGGGGDFSDLKRKNMYNKQQYSPYSSPSSHGSPGYLPRPGTGTGGAGGGAFGGGTPPRPSSGPGGNNGGATLQINQAQQLQINQQSHGHAIQVSAGQHLHLSGDLKGNVSIAAQQGMHFSQQHHQQHNGPGNQQQQHQQQQQQHQQQQQQHQQQQQQHQQQQQSAANQQNPHASNNPQQHPQGNPMMSNHQQMPQNTGGPNMMGNPGGGMQMGPGDAYSMSQSQTINFTQQTLRQRNNPPNVIPNNMGNVNVPMGGGGATGNPNVMGGRLLNAQSLEHQKLLQQQQMLRAQQAAMQQQQQQHMVRPPPPDYKTSAAAGMMQSPARFAPNAGPQHIRRMAPHQPMPPSGPMIRPHNIYMMQQQQQQQQGPPQLGPQQQMLGRGAMYPRQQQQPPMMEQMHGNAEWRHMLMQQQSVNFGQMRPQTAPSMQQAQQQQQQQFGNSMQQMSAMQHQQMRNQAAMVGGGGGSQQMMGGGSGPMNNMNQMLNHMQQQNMMQQQNVQMSSTSLHMQQSQSMTVTNQTLQQQNMNNHQVVSSQGNVVGPSPNSLGNFNPQSSAANDFSLEFLDNLPAADTTSFTDQELLNSFDSDPCFNLDF